MTNDRLPELVGHKIAYKGKRYLVIEVDDDHPFGGFDASNGEFVIFDKASAKSGKSMALNPDCLLLS